jgi:hypothetical protein
MLASAFNMGTSNETGRISATSLRKSAEGKSRLRTFMLTMILFIISFRVWA